MILYFGQYPHSKKNLFTFSDLFFSLVLRRLLLLLGYFELKKIYCFPVALVLGSALALLQFLFLQVDCASVNGKIARCSTPNHCGPSPISIKNPPLA